MRQYLRDVLKEEGFNILFYLKVDIMLTLFFLSFKNGDLNTIKNSIIKYLSIINLKIVFAPKE